MAGLAPVRFTQGEWICKNTCIEFVHKRTLTTLNVVFDGQDLYGKMRNTSMLKFSETPEQNKLAERDRVRQHILRAERKVNYSSPSLKGQECELVFLTISLYPR